MSTRARGGEKPGNTGIYEGNTESDEEIKVVPATGLEPVRCYSLEPESSASANSATRALKESRKQLQTALDQNIRYACFGYLASKMPFRPFQP